MNEVSAQGAASIDPADTLDVNKRIHPLAAALWSLLRYRSAVDRQFVLNALAPRRHLQARSGKDAIAIEAILRFVHERDAVAADDSHPTPRWALGSPSQHRYRKFRSSRADPSDWPSDTYIIKTFGGWSPAVSAAGVGVAPDVLTRRLTCRPKTCSQEDRIVALRQWIAEVDRSGHGIDEPSPGSALAMVDFRAWLKRQRLMSWNTFARGLPRWHEALLEIGLLERHSIAAKARERSAHLPAEQAWLRDLACALDLTQAPARAYGTSRREAEELKAWMRWMLAPLPTKQARDFSISDWNTMRVLLITRAVSEGRWLDPPSSHSFSRDAQIVNWYRAKALAGLIPLREVAKSNAGRSRYSRAELLDALEESATALGHLPSQAEYQKWRSAQMVERLPSQPDLFIPSHNSLTMHLGDRVNWEAVLTAAAEERASFRGLASKGDSA